MTQTIWLQRCVYLRWAVPLHLFMTVYHPVVASTQYVSFWKHAATPPEGNIALHTAISASQKRYHHWSFPDDAVLCGKAKTSCYAAVLLIVIRSHCHRETILLRGPAAPESVSWSDLATRVSYSATDGILYWRFAMWRSAYLPRP